jgi:hypothetical protein
MSATNSVILPEPLPYPKIYDIKDLEEIKNKFCYVLDSYPLEGVALVIARQNEHVCIRVADWSGKIIDLEKDNKYQKYLELIMKEYCGRVVMTMKLISIPKAIFYFSADNNIPRLVDMRLSINKFCGPGYLQDFFGKQGIPVQKGVGDPVVIDDVNYNMITSGKGDYVAGNYILKPSAFKFIIREEEVVPLYGMIKHEIKPTA